MGKEAILETTQTVLRMLREADTALIGTHQNPDGDTLGSGLALALWGERHGTRCDVLNAHRPPANLRFLPTVDRVANAPALPKHDLTILVDMDATGRLGRVAEHFEGRRPMAVVDHHVPVEKAGDVRAVDPTSPATAAILAEAMLAEPEPISADIATCLLTGIVTDTGSYRYQNTTARSMELSARLLELGAEHHRIAEEVFQRKPFAAIRLLARAIEGLHVEADRRLAVATLTYADFQELDALDEHTEGIVSEIMAVSTVEVAALLRESKRGKTRVSLRSRGTFDVAEVARKFDGGGHRAAAGASFDVPPAEAEPILLEALRACLASS